MTVLITGAGKGLGRALAVEFSKKGHDLVLVSRNKRDLEETRSLCSTKTEIFNYDISKPENASRLFKSLQKKDIKIDILVNNAGIGYVGLITETSIIQIKELIDTNYMGSVYTTKAFLDEIKSRSGSIIFINSIAGRILIPNFGAYCASKFALDAFAKSLSKEENINIVNVYPGPMNTNFYDNESFKILKKRYFFIDPEIAANKIITKVLKKKKNIVIPSYLRLLILANRIMPGFVRFLFNRFYE
ncbi:TPA: SDR family oxidoreductase [Candidatus Woesearchaeota archaeon]|nr:SDR family oxidoreductase [Candidatus Woesearchaeota archaeon]HIH31230.1 SDR family oxidoreductase [Candidatus Woesearchaeota archaeon]HIH54657.1 SDR family oxidoreductase [Candidatus Woesearchaeota archaeon]HIJ01389.1 SDR family oxidoreductase [Candidatus Woesearchaeota archaeon]HIJ14286.1 SDR family oxidoreductase [Candidatus Woesearchaeota archaeon]